MNTLTKIKAIYFSESNITNTLKLKVRFSAILSLLLFSVLSPTVQAHICGPSELQIKVGETVAWKITADVEEDTSVYTPVIIGDPNVALMEPSTQFTAHDGDFTFTAIGPGETNFLIDWFFEPNDAGAVCSVSIVVSGEETPASVPDCPDLNGTNGMFQINPELCPDCVSLEQINFDFPGGFNSENSNWGGIEANPLALIEQTGIATGYINVFSNIGWIVQNLSLNVNDSLNISTYFTLFGDTETPALENKNIPLTSIDALITYSANSLTEPLDECNDKDTFPITIGLWDALGVGDGTVKGVGAPPPVATAPGTSTHEPEKYMQPNLVNIEASVNQCFPMSVANSLQYLENSYKPVFEVPDDHKKGQDGDDSLVGQLDMESGRSVVSRHSNENKGVFTNDMYRGKFSYLKKNGLASRLSHKHQGNERETFPSGDFTSSGITSHNEGTEVTFDWLKRQLLDGEDVELVYQWNFGTHTGSHAVRVVGFETTATGKNKIYYAHDRVQSADGIGLKVECEEVKDLNGNGKLNISASGGTVREVTFAMAESVIPCDFECEISSTSSSFEEETAGFLQNGEDLVPVTQKLTLNNRDNAEITVKIFAFCPEEDKKLVSKRVILGDRGKIADIPINLNVSPNSGTSPATFTISCKFDSPSTSVLTFHVETDDGIKLLCGIEVNCNGGEPEETPTLIPEETPTEFPPEHTPTPFPPDGTPTTPRETPITTTFPPETTPTIPLETPFPPETPLTPTPTPEFTPTPTPTPTPPPGQKPCFIYFSIEEPEPNHGDIFISNELAIALPPGTNKIHLQGQGISLLPGGSNADLLTEFTESPDDATGLDGFDIIALRKSGSPSDKHKIMFTVEKDFKVDNRKHKLKRKTITDGDIIFTNGGLIRNKALIDPLDLFTVNGSKPVSSIGIDALEVEGFLNVFDAFSGVAANNIDEVIDIIGKNESVDIIFSLEDINEEFKAGANSALPVGTLVSADDLIEIRIRNGNVSANVIRSGADGIPNPAPDILENCEEEERLGIDAVCVCLPENQVFEELKDLWFSTSLDPTSKDFTHGDTLHHNLTSGCNRFLTNEELTGSKKSGLDGLDFFPDRPDSVSIKQFTFKCENSFTRGAGGLERLVMEPGDNESCVLKLTQLKPGNIIKVSTNHVSGLEQSIKVNPTKGEADSNGEIEFTINAIEKGIDWISWAIPNDKGEFVFNKKSYDNGTAWGMLVEVK